MHASPRPGPLMGLTAYLLSQTASIAKADLDTVLARHGLRLRHMALLATLSDPGPCSQQAVSRRLGMDPSDVTATVDELVELGHVERRVDAEDRRRRVVRLTAKGRRCLTRLLTLADQVAADLLAPLPERRRAGLHRDLLSILTAYDEHRSDAATKETR